MNWIYEPWPWYIAGPMIAFIMFLLIMVDKSFGMSSNLRTLCTMCGAGKKTDFFKFDWKAQKWNLIVATGTVIGGYIGANFLTSELAVAIDAKTISKLNTLGIGGILVGFGARYAVGCTSGHAISGLSNLQLPSLMAVIGFFIGGLLMVHLIFPMIF